MECAPVHNATLKEESFEISDEFDNLFSKQRVLANFNSANKVNDEISLKLEIKDDPMDGNSLIPAEYADSVETLSMCNDSEIICEDSIVEVTDTKVGILECPIKFEDDMTEKTPLKSEETDIPLNERDSNLSCHPRINDNFTIEERTSDSISQNYDIDVSTKNEPFVISDDFDNLFSKQKVLANFSSVNKVSDETFLKLEFKDEQIDDNSLIETLSMCDDSETICEDSMIEIGDTKVGNFVCPIKFEDDLIDKTTLKSEETYIQLKESNSGLCSENVGDLGCLRSNEDNLNRTEDSNKRQNVSEKSQDFRNVIIQNSSTSTGGKSYQCDFCQKFFTQKSTLRNHKLIHTGEKPYQCAFCQMCFKQAAYLKSHILTHIGEKPHRCDICKECFTHKSTLKTHKLKHTGEKPHQCDICQMCFTRKEYLKIHKLKHTGEKPHQCDVCKMRFTQRDSLKSHKLKHTGEKPHRCDICQMCFRVSQSLRIHKLKHTGEKPYQCDICKMGFRESGNLKKHKLIHTGEKPFQCDVCQMRFVALSNLKKHNMIHTGEKPHRCGICKMSFRRADRLKCHKLKHTE